MTTLQQFNLLQAEEAQATVMSWCHCESWAVDVVKHRPFSDAQQLSDYCEMRWQLATPAEVEAALAAHPLIGDVELLRAKFSPGDEQASTAMSEQGQVLQASGATLDELARLNVAYKQRHGFIFVICAKHLSAEVMLAAIRDRIGNSTDDELTCAAAEQRKIFLLRIESAFEGQTP